MEFSSLRGWSLFWKRSEQKNPQQQQPFIIHQTPPLFAPALQLPFQLNGFLSEMQMFSWVTLALEYCLVKPPFIHGGDARTDPGAWAPAPVWKHWEWWDRCLAETIETLVNVSDTWSEWTGGSAQVGVLKPLLQPGRDLKIMFQGWSRWWCTDSLVLTC